ncbi:cytoplasmic 60S subunit biogenesis factor REI1 homolog 1-like isoform X1 [Cynara cardunculus var. scolymus]|uniref:cytoplasmic 60S subunit biogenesis factor REI1 homolog 1-like isoform X1 n=1 Tax=Cynara cardunculus var. scolymus TaxID=59895 RepID=UPI000D62CB0A|nr:cytoplasmic 60S subunit biogenesis factor REI1 homolog 1-like isoform X1 [Cynara cardunculus var. scolymus]
MTGLSCNACNKEFQDENDQKLHYKSEWHRYNLKRKIAGVPGVTESLFIARQSTLAEEKNKLNGPAMLYSCRLCGKAYRSAKAHAQHLKSRTHTMRISEGGHEDENSAIIKPLPPRVVKKSPQQKEEFDDESDDSEWEEVTQNEDLVGEMATSSTHMEVNESQSDDDTDEDMHEDEDELDPACCFMCDRKHKTIESCMVHMHKHHGFFVPDVEYLKDPGGLLTYLGLKVNRDFMCLYCNSNRQPFNSLEAVRKHMVAKSHCKVHYGDDDEEEEAELEEFYDYSSSYVDANGKQLVTANGTSDGIELGSGGSELIITTVNDDTISTKAIGSREYLRYYRQKPRPSSNGVPITAVLAASFRYRSMGLSTVQSKENMVRMKVMKQMNRSGVDAMRSKMGMKSNVIRNLPKNVTH